MLVRDFELQVATRKKSQAEFQSGRLRLKWLWAEFGLVRNGLEGVVFGLRFGEAVWFLVWAWWGCVTVSCIPDTEIAGEDIPES